MVVQRWLGGRSCTCRYSEQRKGQQSAAELCMSVVRISGAISLRGRRRLGCAGVQCGVGGLGRRGGRAHAKLDRVPCCECILRPTPIRLSLEMSADAPSIDVAHSGMAMCAPTHRL